MKRRQFTAQLAASALSLPLLNNALAQGAPSEGNGYEKLGTPQPVSVPAGKIEVIEFFSYACPHCAEFEPFLGAWAKKPPAGVEFRRIPVAFMGPKNFQSLYYALEELKLVDALQGKIFDAVHRERVPLDTPEQIANWVAKNGGDKAKFLASFNSFSVNTKVQRGAPLANTYEIAGVPTLVVQGRYQTSPAIARGNDAAVRVTNYLVDLVRKGK